MMDLLTVFPSCVSLIAAHPIRRAHTSIQQSSFHFMSAHFMSALSHTASDTAAAVRETVAIPRLTDASITRSRDPATRPTMGRRGPSDAISA